MIGAAVLWLLAGTAVFVAVFVGAGAVLKTCAMPGGKLLTGMQLAGMQLAGMARGVVAMATITWPQGGQR